MIQNDPHGCVSNVQYRITGITLKNTEMRDAFGHLCCDSVAAFITDLPSQLLPTTQCFLDWSTCRSSHSNSANTSSSDWCYRAVKKTNALPAVSGILINHFQRTDDWICSLLWCLWAWGVWGCTVWKGSDPSVRLSVRLSDGSRPQSCRCRCVWCALHLSSRALRHWRTVWLRPFLDLFIWSCSIFIKLWSGRQFFLGGMRADNVYKNCQQQIHFWLCLQ